MFTYHLERDRGGRFRLTWGLDAAALERRLALEGVYALKTNLPGRTHPVAEVLRAYKGQARVERRFPDLKGPLGVGPVFLKNPGPARRALCGRGSGLGVSAPEGGHVSR